MKQRDLANLLNRAAAALETPRDLSNLEQDDLVEELTVAAEEAEAETETNDLAYYKSQVRELERQQSVWHQERTRLNGDKLILLRALKGVQDVLRTALEAVEARQMLCDEANSMKKPAAAEQQAATVRLEEGPGDWLVTP